MVMKCPFCRSQLEGISYKKVRRCLMVLAVLVVLIAAVFATYCVWPWPHRFCPVLFPMPNTLVSSAFQDEPGSSGGIVIVYGNISNPTSEPIDPLVSIHINMGSSWEFFHVHAGSIDPGASEYFSWAYHFEDLDVSSTNVTASVTGTR
jgi:hypothetical protein